MKTFAAFLVAALSCAALEHLDASGAVSVFGGYAVFTILSS